MDTLIAVLGVLAFVGFLVWKFSDETPSEPGSGSGGGRPVDPETRPDLR